VLRCQILTAVWGPWHTHRFTNYNLPSLLSAGNFPAFTRDIDTDYVIVTSKADAPAIAQSAAFGALKKFMNPRIVAYPEKVFGHPIETHKKIWQNGYRAATKTRAFYITNPADMIWSDGSFATVAKRLQAGKTSIYAMFARVVDETFIGETDKLHRKKNTIEIPSRSLIDMKMRHLHPFHAAYVRDSSQYPFHYEYVYWPVKGEGLLMRTFATTVLGFFPAIDSITSNYTLAQVRNPDEVDFIDDSDDMCGVSLTPLMKDQNWYATPRKFDIDELGAWWITFDGAAHVPLARTHFHFHTKGTASPEWRRAELSSDFTVNQALLSRELIRTGRILKDNGCQIAAEILATALYGARLRRRWRWRGPLTISVPNDAALAPYKETIADRLLAAGKDAALIDYLSHHIERTRAPDAGTPPGPASTGDAAALPPDVVSKIDLPMGNTLLILNKIVRPLD